MDLMIEDLMEQLVEMGGSDMHVQASSPFIFVLVVNLLPSAKSLVLKNAKN